MANDVSSIGDAVSLDLVTREPPWPSRRTSTWTLFVLTIVSMFTVLDRQVLTLMIEPIKKDFGITDTGAALLMGAAFSVTYGIAGLPIGRLADRYNRRNLISVCLAVWSLATVVCGAAQNLMTLVAARLAVGMGEAGQPPASWSIITDTFPRERVAFATSITSIGLQMGTGLALVLGGASLAFVAHLPPFEIPVIGLIRSWQWAFLIVGIPGLLWSLMVLTIREPARRGLGTSSASQPHRFIEVLRYMASDFRSYAAIIGGTCLKYLLSLGTTQWMPTLMYREFNWNLAKVGLVQGAITLAVAPVALVLGGKWAERWLLQGRHDANLRILLYTLAIAIPLSVVFPLMQNPYLVLALFAVNLFVALLASGPGIAAFQLITPNRMRAQVSAVSLFTVNVIAFALGPLIVALFTDYVFRRPEDLKYAMSLSALILGPIAYLVMLQGLKPYARSYARQIP